MLVVKQDRGSVCLANILPMIFSWMPPPVQADNVGKISAVLRSDSRRRSMYSRLTGGGLCGKMIAETLK